MNRGLASFVTMVLFSIVSLNLFAHTPTKVAIAPLENKASLTDDEVDVLTGSVNAAFLSRSSSLMEVVILEKSTKPCNQACLGEKASTQGATRLVTGSIVSFGGSYTVKLEVRDLATDSIVAMSNSQGVATVIELLPATEAEANKVVASVVPQVTIPTPSPAASTKPAPKRYPTKSYASRPTPTGSMSGKSGAGSASGSLNISSTPSGAVVVIGGRRAGTTPLMKHLEQGVYRVEVSKDGFGTKRDKVTVFIGETRKHHFELKPYGNLLTTGHIFFWSGLMIGGTGAALSLGGELRTLAVGSSIIGGALLLTGLTLWIIRAVKVKNGGNRKRRRGVTMLPTGNDGFAFGYTQTF